MVFFYVLRAINSRADVNALPILFVHAKYGEWIEGALNQIAIKTAAHVSLQAVLQQDAIALCVATPPER